MKNKSIREEINNFKNTIRNRSRYFKIKFSKKEYKKVLFYFLHGPGLNKTIELSRRDTNIHIDGKRDYGPFRVFPSLLVDKIREKIDDMRYELDNREMTGSSYSVKKFDEHMEATGKIFYKEKGCWAEPFDPEFS